MRNGDLYQPRGAYADPGNTRSFAISMQNTIAQWKVAHDLSAAQRGRFLHLGERLVLYVSMTEASYVWYISYSSSRGRFKPSVGKAEFYAGNRYGPADQALDPFAIGRETIEQFSRERNPLTSGAVKFQGPNTCPNMMRQEGRMCSHNVNVGHLVRGLRNTDLGVSKRTNFGLWEWAVTGSLWFARLRRNVRTPDTTTGIVRPWYTRRQHNGLEERSSGSRWTNSETRKKH